MNWKSLLYPLLPSASRRLHDKRRKGLFYRHFSREGLVCQREQDRVFWDLFLHPEGGGTFLEVGAGDGAAGSQTLGLEQRHGWTGTLVEPGERPRRRAQAVRRCRVEGDAGNGATPESPDLLAVHRPADFPKIWEELRSGRLRPRWVVVENREPDPHWCRWLEGRGYRLKFYFHDDEYFKLEP